MTILDRYASDIRTADLSAKDSPDRTTWTANDVVAAFGFAGHASQVREDGGFRDSSPLAVALSRLFCGDNGAVDSVVLALYSKARFKAAALKVTLKRAQALDMARAVLAWYRGGNCKACGGHGYELVPGAPAISEHQCLVCRGTKKVPFDTQFPAQVRVVALWLLAEVEREQCKAGPAAMAKLAERL